VRLENSLSKAPFFSKATTKSSLEFSTESSVQDST